MKTQIITNLFITILLLASFTNEARMKKKMPVYDDDYPIHMFEGEWESYSSDKEACGEEGNKIKVKFTTDYSNCDFLRVNALRTSFSECVEEGHENLSFTIPRERYTNGGVYPMHLISGTREKPQSISTSVFFTIKSCGVIYIYENEDDALNFGKVINYFDRTDLVACDVPETWPNSSVPCTPAEPEPNTADPESDIDITNDPENHCDGEVEIQIQMNMKNQTYDYQLSSDSNSGDK